MIRDDIIQTAKELLHEEEWPDLDGPGAFERVQDKELGYAIQIIDAHGMADESNTTADDYGARVAKWVLWYDAQGQGFLRLEEFPTEAAASHSLEWKGDTE